MKCPNDQATLLITERSGIEIDYCPECRGVWLDRGELDKIIDKNGQVESGREYKADYGHSEQYKTDGYDRKHHEQYGKKKRKESFLSDIFDF